MDRAPLGTGVSHCRLDQYTRKTSPTILGAHHEARDGPDTLDCQAHLEEADIGETRLARPRHDPAPACRRAFMVGEEAGRRPLVYDPLKEPLVGTVLAALGALSPDDGVGMNPVGAPAAAMSARAQHGFQVRPPIGGQRLDAITIDLHWLGLCPCEGHRCRPARVLHTPHISSACRRPQTRWAPPPARLLWTVGGTRCTPAAPCPRAPRPPTWLPPPGVSISAIPG